MLKNVFLALTLALCGSQKPVIIPLRGEIDNDMATEIESKLDDAPGDVLLRINSPGGNVESMFDIIESLREHGNVTCVDSGMAMSAAGLILISDACQTKEMARMSLLHFHLPSGGSEGNVLEQQKQLGLLAALRDCMYEALVHRAGINVGEQIMSEVDAGRDVILTAQEALAMGLVDKIE